MAAHGATQLPTGSIPAGLPVGEPVDEYEKILKISDQVFSGTHPRLKVPRQFVRKAAATRNPPNPPITTQTQVAKTGGLSVSFSDGTEKPPLSTLPEVTSSQTTPSMNGPSAAATATGPSSRIVPKPTSEIDPIFLTKSDDLVRAEIQLERQRVERALREQLDQKKQESRQKTSIQDTKPDFDVSDVLNKALEMVKPSAPSDVTEPNGTGEPSDSFDDNSFYSSRAPDSPQHGEAQRHSPALPSNTEDLTTEAPVENYSDELQRLEALNRTGSDQEMQDTYHPVADQHSPYRHRQAQNAQVEFATPRSLEVQPPTDALEEPEYSPPAPGVPPMERRSQEYRRGHTEGTRQRRAPEDRPYDRTRYARRSISPGGDVRIVRNHITSPAAPQPSRVSPLAIAKVPSVNQHKDSRPEYGSDRGHPGQDSDRATPDGPAPQLMSRKRRRLHEGRDRPRQASYRRQGVDSSDPYIKEEPVSPPPFADTPPLRARQPQERPIYIDIASPRYTPVAERREPSVREPAYEMEPYHEIHAEPGIQRTVSRMSTRRPMRDDQDLRRVASLQNARQPEYSREYIDQHSPRALRAGSYAVVERPPQEQPRYYDEPVHSYSRRYIPADDSPTSPRYREAYYEEEPPARIMAPPARRIVIDEHGNQYYETIPLSRMQPMPPPVRMPKGDIYEDRPSVHPASVRAASIVEDPYGGRRYVQEMPPPQSTYRRVTDYARPTPAERRPYSSLDEREPYPRSSSVQVAEYPRHAPYIEESEMPRERLIRMSSVRPPTAARYEEPREMIQRVESVRPGGRDMSVYVDDDPRRAREYIERPVYVTARPPAREERYYEGGEPERMVLEGARDVVHRAPPRY